MLFFYDLTLAWERRGSLSQSLYIYAQLRLPAYIAPAERLISLEDFAAMPVLSFAHCNDSLQGAFYWAAHNASKQCISMHNLASECSVLCKLRDTFLASLLFALHSFVSYLLRAVTSE